MASMAQRQKQAFQSRIKRINKGGPNTSGYLLVGSQDGTAGKRNKPIRIRRGETFGTRLAAAIKNLFIAPVAFVVGGLSMVLGIAAAYHLDALQFTQSIEIEQAAFLLEHIDLLMAVLLALVLGFVLRLGRGPRFLAMMVGLIAVFILQDQLMSAYPEPFAVLMPDQGFTLPDPSGFLPI